MEVSWLASVATKSDLRTTQLLRAASPFSSVMVLARDAVATAVGACCQLLPTLCQDSRPRPTGVQKGSRNIDLPG